MIIVYGMMAPKSPYVNKKLIWVCTCDVFLCDLIYLFSSIPDRTIYI